jgi:hypothetical protein
MDDLDENEICTKCKNETQGALYGKDVCFTCYEIDFDLDNEMMED